MLKTNVTKTTFLHAQLNHLSADEKCMLMQAGILLADLRFFDLQLLKHFEFLRSGIKPEEAEIGILFSQITILIAHLAGTLNESYNVVQKSFFSRPVVSKTYSPLLSKEARSALARIKAYFSKGNNLVSTLRNNFGFHYDRDRILEFIAELPSDWEHYAYFPDCVNNAFIEFGQVCSTNALFYVNGKGKRRGRAFPRLWRACERFAERLRNFFARRRFGDL